MLLGLLEEERERLGLLVVHLDLLAQQEVLPSFDLVLRQGLLVVLHLGLLEQLVEREQQRLALE